MTHAMEDRIAKKLAQALQPYVLEVHNDSARHHGHAGDDGSGETHFNVLVVSDCFAGKSRIERQRMVYDALSQEMRGGIHALSLKTLARGEYERM